MRVEDSTISNHTTSNLMLLRLERTRPPGRRQVRLGDLEPQTDDTFVELNSGPEMRFERGF